MAVRWAPGIDTLRVNGWANGPTTYDLTISKSVGGQAPVMNAFAAVAQVDGSQTSWTTSGLATGTHHFRVRGMHDGVIGYYVTDT